MGPSAVSAPHDEEEPGSRLAEIVAATDQYERWGLNTLRSPDDKELFLVTDDAVNAIELNRGLGGEVQNYLAVRLLDGPVIELPGTPSRWAFLVSARDPAGTVNIVRVRAREGRVLSNGAMVPLPPSLLDSGKVVWRQAPRQADRLQLPTISMVVCALRAVTETAGLS